MSIQTPLSSPPDLPLAIDPATLGTGIRDRRHGELPGYLFTPGKVGILSETGRLIAEVALQTTALGLGQSDVLSGAETSIAARDFKARLAALLDERRTAALVLILSPSGRACEDAIAALSADDNHKPVIVHIEGTDRPEGPRLADGTGESDRAARLATAFRAAGATVVDQPARIGRTVQAAIETRAQRVATENRFVDFAAAMRFVEREVYGA